MQDEFDHEQRVVDEKTELDIKLERLKVFLTADIFSTLTMQNQDLLSTQCSYMAAYSRILGERINLFKGE
jgi:hypothetical protein